MTKGNTAYINQLKDHVGQEVTLQGWLYNSRASGKIQFLIVRDGTGLCQCIVEKGKVPTSFSSSLSGWARSLRSP
jgi:asparaginyl-tRNA synthetase